MPFATASWPSSLKNPIVPVRGTCVPPQNSTELSSVTLSGVIDTLLASAPDVNGSKLIVAELPAGSPIDSVRTQAERVRQKAGSAFVVFGWKEDEGKVSLLAALSPDLVKKGLKAGDMVKAVAEVVGGKGGGKPDMAQAGGKDAAKLSEALKKAEQLGRTALANGPA